MAHVSAEDRSKQFVLAAAQVIARDGLAAATTRRIAAEAGAPLAALHYCFRTKDDLLEEVYHHLSRDYAKDLPPLAEGAALEDIVQQHARRIWHRMVTTPHEQLTAFELLLRMQRLGDGADRDRALKVNRTMFDAWIKSTASVLTQGARSSGIEAAVNMEMIARYFIATLDGISLQHLADPDEERSWALVETLVDAVVALIRK